MKKFLFSFLLLVATAASVSAQTIVKGDLNDDGDVTIADVTASVNTILGKTPKQTISVSASPFTADNSYVVGTWYMPDGTKFTFNADGTTDYPDGATYAFYPVQSRILVKSADGVPVCALPILEATDSYLLTMDYTTGAFYYLTDALVPVKVTSITLSESSITMQVDDYKKLTATVLPSNADNTKVNWSSSDESVAEVTSTGGVAAVGYGTCTITCAATDGSGVKGTCKVTVAKQLVTGITLNLSSLSLEVGGTSQLTATVSPTDADDPSVQWSSSSTAVATVSSSGLVTAVAAGTATITCTATDGSGVKATCKVTVEAHQYVDLGLPSGTLWATCNVGATSPEDYGDYFAWGETTGYNSGKADFDWDTYKYCKGSEETLTKYCNKSYLGYNGFTDNLTELELSDDAAYVNWGSNWRMPSADQFNELINSNYTTTEWTTMNGVYGRKITSKSNGKSIFLPAAGYRLDTSLSYAGSFGYYWSRSLYTSYPSGAWYLYFYSSGVDTDYADRCYGRSVRPVRFSE